LDEAIAEFRKAIRLEPELGPAHFNLGLAFFSTSKRREAVEELRKALKLEPNSLAITMTLGRALLNLDSPQEVEELARRAIALSPDSSTSHLMLGEALMQQGRYTESDSQHRRAMELDPKDHLAPQSMALLMIDRGEPDAALPWLERSIQLQPRQGAAYFYWSQIVKATDADRPRICDMEALLRQPGFSALEQEYLHFALAKCYDDLAQCGEAMPHFEAGHRIAHDRAAPENRFVAQDDERIKLRTIEILDKRFLEKHRGVGLDSDVPIFICGMIRSGTTLMEQIVSSHPEVGAAGELAFWTDNWWTCLDLFSARLDSEKLRSVTAEYLDMLLAAAPGMARVTDKMPGNVVLLGLIHLALPNARIIRMERHPVDTCLSILTTRFSKPPEFASSKEAIASQYRLYERLAEHWRGVLPEDRFLEVRYENLIAEPERVVHSVLEFLGLPWNDACINFHLNQRSVKTPSVWSVRQPIYKSSVERWRRYEPWLGALAELVPS
jgi:tetratricopeptide (TPR) repeat protein